MTVIPIHSRSRAASENQVNEQTGENCLGSVGAITPDHQTLRLFEPFSSVPEAVISAISAIADFRDYKDGETILSAGEPLGNEFYIVSKGALSLTQSNSLTGELVVEVVETGQAFCLELAVAPTRKEIPQNRTLTAIGDVEVWVVESEAFKSVFNSKPTLAKNLIAYFSDELATVRFGMAQSVASPEQMICEHILGLVQRDEIDGTWSVPKLPRHRDLAKATGAKEADVAATVASLIRNSVADRAYPGLTINNMKRLEELASQH